MKTTERIYTTKPNPITGEVSEIRTENIYLNRLKEQYIKYYKVNERDSFEKLVEKVEYLAMRLFCLDTQLLSINAIENMQNEVNSQIIEDRVDDLGK